MGNNCDKGSFDGFSVSNKPAKKAKSRVNLLAEDLDSNSQGSADQQRQIMTRLIQNYDAYMPPRETNRKKHNRRCAKEL